MEIIRHLTNLLRLQNSAQMSSVEYPVSLFLLAVNPSFVLYQCSLITSYRVVYLGSPLRQGQFFLISILLAPSTMLGT